MFILKKKMFKDVHRSDVMFILDEKKKVREKMYKSE